MNLEDLFRNLSYGELSNLSLAGDGDGTIQQSKQGKIVNYINDGLLRLYSTFVLKERDIVVALYDDITNYHLVPRFALNYVAEAEGIDECRRYILDLPLEPFEGDILKVLRVHSHHSGCVLPLNDESNPRSIFTPQANVLQVPFPITGLAVNVVYQARHKQLDGSLDQEIEVPVILESALTAWVGYKVYSHMNTAEATAKAQEHMQMYTNLVEEARDKDMVNTSLSGTNVRFNKNGWC